MCKVPGIETQRMSGSQPHEKKKGGNPRVETSLCRGRKAGNEGEEW